LTKADNPEMNYPEYPASATDLEERVLAQWREEDLFRRTLEATAGGQEFVFHEGPPTANGRPGIHHVISRTIKDLVCRFQTMRGRHVTRIAGWDTHGLPVEIEAEKKLGINGKRDIERIGVARFNEVCRESVFTYKEEWERLSERIGYWLDYSRAYVTFTAPYIESIWHILGRFWNDGLIYRGHKSVPYCPRCGTALSSHEVSLGYEDVSDPSLYFLCPWLTAEGDADPEGRAFLVWTTTPWTLPANVALAIHPDLDYVEVELGGRKLVLAESRLAAVAGDDARVLRRYGARELEGQRYARPFEILEAPPGDVGWRVVLETFVTADDGTGIVHLAPAFGADDYASGQRHDLPLLRPVDDAGCFEAGIPLVGGRFVKDADPVLVEDLERRGRLFRHTFEVHTYPHCWRCRSPLIYMARDSWYIRTTALKQNLLDNNAQVGWHPPEVGTGRFGEWLEGNVDWALSRERYWGTPLPAWVCDADPSHVDFIDSYAALSAKAGPLPDDFEPHKPYIDEVVWSCTRCSATMHRTPEVIDVWFDSGSMPYAQWHYPFENREEFERHFPADFICEGVDQTRGWFYSLMAISTMLGLGPAYRNVVVNDLVLDAEGQKMSKSRGNVVDPWTAIEQFGVDAIRWYFVTVSHPWVPKRFDPAALGEGARRTFDTLAHTYRFFAMYANIEDWSPTDEDVAPERRGPLDRWILSRTATLAVSVHADFAGYDLTKAARAIGEFIVDDLSNWYVRRSRDRFYGRAGHSDPIQTRAAFATLHEVLVAVSRMLAPVTPFQADWLHRALCDGRSVHLERFPVTEAGGTVKGGERDAGLEGGMQAVRELVRLGRAARDKVKIRVRQPLATLHAVVPEGRRLDEHLIEVLRDELNIRSVRFPERAEELLTYRASPKFRVIGKRFGSRTQRAADRIRALDSDRISEFKAGGPLFIELDGKRFDISAEEIELREEPRGDLAIESDAGFTVALDTTIDDSLRVEGVARELINRIQRMRRDAGFDVSDRVRLAIGGGHDVREALDTHGERIAAETLAVDLRFDASPTTDGWEHSGEVELDSGVVWLGLVRAK
jgi:isoleucyl-tRNA synthetase